MIEAVTDDRKRMLVSRWSSLLPGHAGLGLELVRRYADPGRRYHGLDHLAAVLDGVELLSREATEPRPVLLAAWFHDAVYDVRREDNEERSAQLAEQTLSEAGLPPTDVAEIARLVRLTTTHDPAPGDANGAALCDADLAVLAGDERAYSAYVSAVRAEYAHVGDDDFRRGRAAVLEQLLSLPALFRTSFGHARWEAAARRNLSNELGLLRSGGASDE